MRTVSKIKAIVILLGALVSVMGAHCAFSMQDPIKMLESVTSKIMTELRENQEEIRQHPSKIYDTVEHDALPHVDFVEMGRWVVGRNAWRQASEQTKNAFIREFKILVVRSYARSLLEYLDYKIIFLPLRVSITDQKRIEVLSLLKGEGRSFKMNYRLVNDNNDWKVFDIILENVSLVQGYRAQFSEDIQKSGLNAVVETIRHKNETFDLEHERDGGK